MSSFFETCIGEAKSKPGKIVVRLSTGFSFVLRATRDYWEQRAISEQAVKNSREVLENHKRFEWEDHRAEGETNEEFAMCVGRATHYAMRHIGFIGEDGLVEEPWTIAQFLALKRYDGSAFGRIMDAINEAIGVGYGLPEYAEQVNEKKDTSEPTEDPPSS